MARALGLTLLGARPDRDVSCRPLSAADPPCRKSSGGLAACSCRCSPGPGSAPGLLWFLHLLLIAGITVGLWFIQRDIRLGENIARWPDCGSGPSGSRSCSSRFTCRLAGVVGVETAPAGGHREPFPDLDDAWSQVVESLEKAGIGIGDTPVFLVFGRSRGPRNRSSRPCPAGWR